MAFGLVNWSILGAYLIGSLGMGWFISRQVHTASDYFTAGRQMPWWAIGLSILATYVSALSFLGGPAWSYAEGLGVVLIHANYPLVVLVVITLFLPYFYRANVPSIYHYIGQRFGQASRTVMAAIFLLTQCLSTGAVLFATALVFEFITGMPVHWAIVLISLTALAYSLLGGIAAVIWTDVLQSVVLFIGAVGVVYFLVSVSPPLAQISEQLVQADKLNSFPLSPDFAAEATVYSGVIAMTLYHITVYGASQMMVQRALTARSLDDAKRSFLFMGYGAFFIYLLFMLIGLGLFVYYKGQPVENGNTLILQFITDEAPTWMLGVVAAAVIAASMSSVDSALNSMATVTAVDFYDRLKPDGATCGLELTRWFTVLWAILIIIPALLFSLEKGSVLKLLSQAGSYFVGAKLAMFLLGFFSRKTCQTGLLTGVVAAFIAVAVTAVFTDIAWPWYAAIGGGVNILVARLVSLFTAMPTYPASLCWRNHWHELTLPAASRGLLAIFAINLLLLYWLQQP